MSGQAFERRPVIQSLIASLNLVLIMLALVLLSPQPVQAQQNPPKPKNAKAAVIVAAIREAEQEFRFIDIPSAPVPSLLRSFSAPVKVMRDWRDDELAFLFAHDRDEFNRWDAGQQLMLRHLQA